MHASDTPQCRNTHTHTYIYRSTEEPWCFIVRLYINVLKDMHESYVPKSTNKDSSQLADACMQADRQEHVYGMEQ